MHIKIMGNCKSNANFTSRLVKSINLYAKLLLVFLISLSQSIANASVDENYYGLDVHYFQIVAREAFERSKPGALTDNDSEEAFLLKEVIALTEARKQWFESKPVPSSDIIKRHIVNLKKITGRLESEALIIASGWGVLAAVANKSVMMGLEAKHDALKAIDLGSDNLFTVFSYAYSTDIMARQNFIIRGLITTFGGISISEELERSEILLGRLSLNQSYGPQVAEIIELLRGQLSEL